jgi:hypothetical protein
MSMIKIMRALFWMIGSWLKSREQLRAENLTLPPQVTVPRRCHRATVSGWTKTIELSTLDQDR